LTLEAACNKEHSLTKDKRCLLSHWELRPLRNSHTYKNMNFLKQEAAQLVAKQALDRHLQSGGMQQPGSQNNLMQLAIEEATKYLRTSGMNEQDPMAQGFIQQVQNHAVQMMSGQQQAGVQPQPQAGGIAGTVHNLANRFL
jgi:hypothetical protein